MNGLLQLAYKRAAALPREEQDKIALFLLAELESELLEKMADEALSLHRQRKLEDSYGALSDGKPSFSKSEEREAARRARASRYMDDS